jgi:hypothetical protein
MHCVYNAILLWVGYSETAQTGNILQVTARGLRLPSARVPVINLYPTADLFHSAPRTPSTPVHHCGIFLYHRVKHLNAPRDRYLGLSVRAA